MFFGFVKLFFQKSLNPALFFLAQCCLFSSGFVGNGYGLCSIINGFQRVDLFGVSLTPADEAATPAAPAIQQVIKPYMGKEQVFVQVSLNLVHFNQPKAQEPSED